MNKNNNLRGATRCLLLIILLVPPTAPAQSTDPGGDSPPAESPYLDFQWNSGVIRSLLSVPTGRCQADANPDAAPKENDPGAWSHTLQPSMLRAMYYLAYDYYGLGLNHYFTFRQDLQPDFDRRFAAAKPRDASGATQLVTADYTAFKRSSHPGALQGAVEVAANPGANSTHVYYRHAVVDPFDLELLADRIHSYRLVLLAPIGQRKSPMELELPADSIDRYYAGGYTNTGQGIGLQRLSAFAWPGSENPTDSNWQPDYRHYSHLPSDPARSPEPVRAPYLVGTRLWHVDESFLGAGMLSIDGGAHKKTLCQQWRLQQEREAAGEATAGDRLLKDLMQRAGYTDEAAGHWVIPAEGF